MNSTCPYCGVGCGVCVTPQGSQQAVVTGDPHHPASLGRLCVKGAALGETLIPEGRLLTARVDGQPVSLASALDAAAAGLRAVTIAWSPAAKTASATARPMPVEQPVMSQVFIRRSSRHSWPRGP